MPHIGLLQAGNFWSRSCCSAAGFNHEAHLERATVKGRGLEVELVEVIQ